MGRKKIFITLFMAVVLIMNGCFGTLEAKAQEVTTVGSLEEFDVADFNQWKSGLYALLTGMYRMNIIYV